MTSTERAVRKASGERLLADFRRAAVLVGYAKAGYKALGVQTPGEALIARAVRETSRTRYACLMTAFGQ